MNELKVGRKITKDIQLILTASNLDILVGGHICEISLISCSKTSVVFSAFIMILEFVFGIYCLQFIIRVRNSRMKKPFFQRYLISCSQILNLYFFPFFFMPFLAVLLTLLLVMVFFFFFFNSGWVLFAMHIATENVDFCWGAFFLLGLRLIVIERTYKYKSQKQPKQMYYFFLWHQHRLNDDKFFERAKPSMEWGC